MQYSQPLPHCQPSRAKQVDHWLQIAQQMIWPPTCVLCSGRGRLTRDLCAACEADLPLNTHCCEVCALPLQTAGLALLCGRCVRRRPSYDLCIAALRYAYPVDRLIQGLKYSDRVCIARVLGDVFADQVVNRERGDFPEVLIPMPLSDARFRSRGYNQAHELGRRIAARCAVPLRADLVERVRDTAEQAGLSRVERRSNVRGAFRVVRPLTYARVAVIDDVVTTGSTVEELTRLLRRSGVQRVEAWAAARAGGPR